jgi:hypothetical protein
VKDLVRKKFQNEADLNPHLQNQMKTTRKRRKTNKRNETNPDKRKKSNSQKNKLPRNPRNQKNNKARSLPFEKKFQTFPFTKYCCFTWKERKAVNS